MKNIKVSLVLGSLLGGLTAAGPAMSADLLDVYRLAQQNDPEIAIAEANFRAAAEASPQARASYLPQIEANVNYGQTDSTSVGEQFFAGQIFPDDSESESTTTSWTVSLRQTLFNWGTVNQIQQAAAEVARAEAEYRAAEQQLIVRVAEAYFELLAAKDSLEASRINKESIARQLDQAKKRFEVGLIAITDVQESQAAFDQATAEVIAAERTAFSTRENLRAVIGEYVDAPAAPTEDMPLASPMPESPENWVEKALEQNLTIVASRFALESAEHTTGIRRAGHYPTLDFVAEHGETDSEFDSLDFTQVPTAPGTGTSEQTRDFIGLQLNVPIFSGGATQSRTRQAAYQESAARSSLKQAIRNAESQTRDAYLGVISDIARVQALKQAYESAQTALRATQAGYEVGTRTAVDVLTARRNELQALITYQRARYDYVLNSLRLKQAAGILTGEDVAEVATWMK
ncbi:MAG: TolC family outer membrane protein [Proteobacteria bacterium]|nr:TolC family outer membrane protein [Pseudomonadota bacterium]